MSAILMGLINLELFCNRYYRTWPEASLLILPL